MKVDCALVGAPRQVAQAAAEAEALGYDGVAAAEINHDPFLQLLLAAEATERIELMTSIAVAFARSPMTLALQAHDLQVHSGGRFVLGLGSQIKAHVQYRFSMPWSRPADRMRELILAVRAIWRSWNEDTPLEFKGEFYTHTLMPPFFRPEPSPSGPPPVLLAAVGPRMTEVAGEVADGLLVHGFTTPRFLREVTLPAVERGLATSGRERADFSLCYPAFVVTGSTEQEVAWAREAVKAQIAFYGSTPAYLPVLELHGWAGLHDELRTLSKNDGWAEMPGLVTDEMLETFAVVAAPERVAGELLARFGDVVDRLSFYAPYETQAERWLPIAEELRASA